MENLIPVFYSVNDEIKLGIIKIVDINLLLCDINNKSLLSIPKPVFNYKIQNNIIYIQHNDQLLEFQSNYAKKFD